MQNQDTSMMGMLEESMLERYDEIHVAEILADDEDDDGGKCSTTNLLKYGLAN